MSAVAPAAPGALGVQIEPQLLFSYLDALTAWIAGRRAELDELDSAVQNSAHAAELTGDIRLGLTLWQSIKTRDGLLMTTWDSGRVGPLEREKLSSLIWGRLDTPGSTNTGGAGTQGLSLPEACRLSDALTSQLRQRLQLDPSGSAVLVRVSGLRATLERLRDQVALEPSDRMEAARRQLADLASRLQSVSEKAARGGDVGGLLGPLEQTAATFERDLIVGGAMRRQIRGRVEAASASLQALAAREPALRDLVRRVVAAVSPAPKYAVPDVDALGPVPATSEPDLAAYEERLALVGRAMDVVEASYSGALAELDALRVDLADIKCGDDPVLGQMISAAKGLLAQAPCPVDAARLLVGGCRQYSATHKGA